MNKTEYNEQLKALRNQIDFCHEQVIKMMGETVHDDKPQGKSYMYYPGEDTPDPSDRYMNAENDRRKKEGILTEEKVDKIISKDSVKTCFEFEVGETCYYSTTNIVRSFAEYVDNTNKVFWKTRQQADFIHNRQRLERHMWQFAWIHNGDDRMNGFNIGETDFFFIMVDLDIKPNHLFVLDLDHAIFNIPFKTEEIAEKALEFFKEDIEKYYFWRGES